MGEKAPENSKRDRMELMVVYALAVALVAGLAILWARQQGWFRSTPQVVFSPDKLLDRPIEINTARAEDLRRIRGIGEKRAADIILLRDNLIRQQKADRTRAKGARYGWQSLEEFIDAVRLQPGINEDITDELRATVRVEPMEK